MRAYLPAYDLIRPTGLNEALALLAEGGLTPLAGGTDLMVIFEMGELPPGRYLSIWGIEELHGITVDESAITIGALTTFGEIRRSRAISAELPMLVAAAEHVGTVAIQNRATIGGNIANASPAADSPPALLAYDAELLLTSAAGERVVPYADFHRGYKAMDLHEGELIRAARIPRRPPNDGLVQHYRKVGTRKAQAISKTCFAGLGRLDAGVVAEVRIGVGSVAPTVIRARGAEAALLGKTLDAATRRAARAALEAEIDPIDDIRSTADYRRVVTGNVLDEFLGMLAASAG